MRLTTETEAALLHAVMLAGRARDMGAEHVLLSLSRGAPSQAQDLLTGLGVVQSDVRVFFSRRRGGPTTA